MILLVSTIDLTGGGHSGLVVSALDSGSEDPGLSPGRATVLCLLGGGGGGVALLLVASCYRNWDKLLLCEQLGSCADFTFQWI